MIQGLPVLSNVVDLKQSVHSMQKCPSHHCSYASSSELHFHIDTSRKIKLHQRIDSLSSRVENINHALVCPDFKMEPSILVNVRRLENTVDTLLGWQWNRTHRLCIGVSRSIKYLLA